MKKPENPTISSKQRISGHPLYSARTTVLMDLPNTNYWPRWLPQATYQYIQGLKLIGQHLTVILVIFFDGQ